VFAPAAVQLPEIFLEQFLSSDWMEFTSEVSFQFPKKSQIHKLIHSGIVRGDVQRCNPQVSSLLRPSRQNIQRSIGVFQTIPTYEINSKLDIPQAAAKPYVQFLKFVEQLVRAENNPGVLFVKNELRRQVDLHVCNKDNWIRPDRTQSRSSNGTSEKVLEVCGACCSVYGMRVSDKW